MDLGTAKTKAIKLINEYSTNGNITSSVQNADYTLRMNELADAAQKEIAQVKKIHAVYSISQNPIPNQMGLLQGFDLKQFLPGTDYIVTAKGSKAYYFEVDRQGTVYIEEETTPGTWTVLKTITVPSTVTSFTAYKGNVTPSNVNNNVRMRFTGIYPYNIRNTALYAYSFSTDNDVPDYRPFVRYQMPANFYQLNKVVHETDPRQYVDLGYYFWEGKRTLVLNYYLTGSFQVHYFAYPSDITSTTPDSYVFEVDTEAQELIPYYIAGHVILDENPAVATTLLNLYQQKLAILDGNDYQGVSEIQNVFGW